MFKVLSGNLSRCRCQKAGARRAGGTIRDYRTIICLTEGGKTANLQTSCEFQHFSPKKLEINIALNPKVVVVFVGNIRKPPEKPSLIYGVGYGLKAG